MQSHRLERALAQTEHLRVYDHRAITDITGRSNGRRGRAALAKATAREPEWTRNDFEARFLKLIRDAGLPEPLVNQSLDAPDYGECKPDFHWPSHRVIVETDGWETHGTRAAFLADRRKDAALHAAGWRVLRFRWDDVEHDPATVIGRVESLLGYSRASDSLNASSSGSSIE